MKGIVLMCEPDFDIALCVWCWEKWGGIIQHDTEMLYRVISVSDTLTVGLAWACVWAAQTCSTGSWWQNNERVQPNIVAQLLSEREQVDVERLVQNGWEMRWSV